MQAASQVGGMFNPVNANQAQGALGVGQGGRGVTGFSILEKVIGLSASWDRRDRQIANPNEGCPSTTGDATYFAGAQHSKQEKQNKLAAKGKASTRQVQSACGTESSLMNQATSCMFVACSTPGYNSLKVPGAL